MFNSGVSNNWMMIDDLSLIYTKINGNDQRSAAIYNEIAKRPHFEWISSNSRSE